jgi:hypothetical protein
MNSLALTCNQQWERYKFSVTLAKQADSKEVEENNVDEMLGCRRNNMSTHVLKQHRELGYIKTADKEAGKMSSSSQTKELHTSANFGSKLSINTFTWSIKN